MSSMADTLKQLGPARLGIMGAVLVGLLMFFVFVSMRITTPSMKLLYADLSSEDSGSVAAKLEETQIPYEISTDGSRVTVPEDQVGRARMLLADAGLPNGGSLGYELFDNQSGFGTTNFVQNINQVRALEGELARTITSLDNIRSTRVHLVLPQRELFSRDNRAASASVFLGVRAGSQIQREQILSIQSLVSSAVADLKPSDVSIIDSNGNLLAKGEDDSANANSLKAEEMRLSTERRLAEKIEDQVNRVVGYGNVRATVTSVMNFDRTSTNEELFDPEGQVLRSSQTSEEQNTERDADANDVSVENNLPGVGGDLLSDTAPSQESNRVEETTNYEISRTTRNTIREGGQIERLSVAVLVNGTKGVDEEGAETYTPRTQAELDQIATLVRGAIGFDDLRGDTVEVINMQFAEIDTDQEFIDERLLLGFEKNKLLEVAEIITVAIMIILVVMLVLQPMINRLLATESSEMDETLEADLLAGRPMNPALAAPDGSGGGDYALAGGGSGMEEEESLIDIQGVEGKVKASSMKKVEEIVENYPAETVAVIRSWMAGDET